MTEQEARDIADFFDACDARDPVRATDAWRRLAPLHGREPDFAVFLQQQQDETMERLHAHWSKHYVHRH